MTRPLLFCPVLLLAALGPATGDALTVSVDEFSITRDGLAFFDDPFGDGTPPPAAPDFASRGAASYGVTGTIPSDAESGGELHLDSTDGALIDNADGAPRDAIVITLLTSTTGGDTQIGSGDTFDEKGDFSLTTPPGPLYSVYGVRLTDSAGSGAAHQVLQLGVEFDPMTGRNDVAYLLQDFDAHSVPVLASADFDPPAEANEIRLELARPDATDDQVLASVSYLSGGVAVPGSFSFIMPGWRSSRKTSCADRSSSARPYRSPPARRRSRFWRSRASPVADARRRLATRGRERPRAPVRAASPARRSPSRSAPGAGCAPQSSRSRDRGAPARSRADAALPTAR